MKSFFKRFWPVLAILLVDLVLFVCNYKKGTFLIGWDNLYPELNFSVNIKRSFFSVWQEYRSLGYVDSMSQTANLFHDLFRYFLSFFLPLNLIRWFFVFLMFFLGGVGIYCLMKDYVLEMKHSDFLQSFVALICGLFYQFNLITIQMFFLPFELFLVHFAILPWLILFALKFLDFGQKKYLWLFALFSFLSISQAHVPTIFIVYVLALFLVILTKLLLDKRLIKRVLILILATFLINSFWGLPFTFATLKNAKIIANSKNNQMATEDIFYRNIKYGKLQEVLMLKGVVLDYWQNDYKTGISHFMMQPWLDYMQTLAFKIPALLFIVLMVLGIAVSIKEKRKRIYPLLVLFLFSFAMMAIDTPVFSSISWVLREKVPLFGNIFRFVFTKFSLLYAFCYTVFFGLGLMVFINILKNKRLKVFFLLSICLLVFIYTLPSFKKHFFYENLAVRIPGAYFKTFNFFNNQDKSSRIAIFPISNYWAWTQNNWNTIGSGFFWYGLAQSTTDRAFDPWSDKNENLYWELDQAVYSENYQLLEKVLEKYDIDWLILDESINSYLSAPKFSISKYEELFTQSAKIKLIASFDFIRIYAYGLEQKPNNFVSVKSDLLEILPSYRYDNYDQAYLSFGNYQSSEGKEEVIFFPFRSLFSAKNLADQEYDVKYDSDSFSFVSQLDAGQSGLVLRTPPITVEEFLVIDPLNVLNQKPYWVSMSLNGETLLESDSLIDLYGKEISLPSFSKGILKITFRKMQTNLYDSSKDANFLNHYNDGCRKNSKGIAKLETTPQSLKFISQGSDNCVSFEFPDLSQRYGYLVHLQTDNSKIRGLYLNFINSITKKTDFDTYLDYDGKRREYSLISSPRDPFGLGYSLNFNNISFDREEVVNSLNFLEVYQIPFYFLKGIRIEKNYLGDNYRGGEPIPPTRWRERWKEVDVWHPNPSVYKVKINESINNETLVLSQGYDSGWIALEVQKSKIKYQKLKHVLINNWENGWDINSKFKSLPRACRGVQSSKLENESTTIYLFYWPQLLEYLGFGLMLGGLIFIWRWKE